MTSIPNQIRGIFPKLSNLHIARASFAFGASFSVVAYAVMHRLGPIGGQGALDQEGWQAWTARSVALGCLLCSSPKVLEWLSSAFGAPRDSDGRFLWGIKRWEALGATIAVELSIALVADPYISLVMLLFSAIINGLAVGHSVVEDHAAVQKARRPPRKAAHSLFKAA